MSQNFEVSQTQQQSSLQAKNNAGGFSFTVTPWDSLDRFLILGTEGGTYYASERTLTLNNVKNVTNLLKEDGIRVVERVVEISDSGRAPKNDPALFVLALASASDNLKVRQAAFKALPKVARIGTHLFHYAAFVNEQRGWGRALRRAIADWYLEQDESRLANQVIKYQQRDGWSHRDLLRLAHPKTSNNSLDSIFKWVVDGYGEMNGKEAFLNPQIQAFEQAKKATSESEIIKLIRDQNLPREAIPTQWLNSPNVWEALLEKMPMTAMIRNIATMTRVGLLGAGSASEAKVKSMLANQDALRKARVHPIQVLSALTTYQSGHGARGQNTWTPEKGIVDSLDSAFYLSFGNVEPTGKNTLIGLDVSGSMEMGLIAGVPGLTPRAASVALALITANVEPNFEVVGFTGGRTGGWTDKTSGGFRGNTALTQIKLTKGMSLQSAIAMTSKMDFGSTDCSLPFRYAKECKLPVENFAVYTDNETYGGSEHPHVSLQKFRSSMGIGAKSVVVGMTASNFTIADPTDSGMMDVVGFDTAAPQLMSDFFKG